MRYVIIEDSRLARLELKTLLAAHPQLQLVGEAANLPDAKDLIEQSQPDLVLLDIDLGGDNAFDLLAQLVFIPRIIFTTAFAEHALQAFNYPTVDYLLKPVSAPRLAAALANFAPQLLLLDLGLPGEDGLSIAARMRQQHPQLGIVMLTARTQLHERLLGHDQGADHYLCKPVELAELLAVIAEVQAGT